jgi:hypothetical protein
MPIKSTLYVNITSGVIGADTVATRELTGRRFSTSPMIPSDAVVSVLSGGAQEYFGASSPEATFASQYFSYISPAPASRAKNLQFAAYSPTGRAPTLFGARNSTSIPEFGAVLSGTISIQLGESPLTVNGIDLTTALSYAAVASAVQSAIRTAGSAQPQYASMRASS